MDFPPSSFSFQEHGNLVGPSVEANPNQLLYLYHPAFWHRLGLRISIFSAAGSLNRAGRKGVRSHLVMSLPSEAGFSQQKLENHQQEIRVSRKQRGMAPMIIKFHASKFTCQQQNEEITSQYGIEWIVSRVQVARCTLTIKD